MIRGLLFVGAALVVPFAATHTGELGHTYQAISQDSVPVILLGLWYRIRLVETRLYDHITKEVGKNGASNHQVSSPHAGNGSSP